MDFVLWKPSGPQDPAWESPAGIATPGRPGWHIECSAMAWKHLIKAFETRLSCDDPKEREVFDIHGGGIDLVFPHHENEIAQSCCAFDMARMANVWMHNGFLQVEGEKMSKSLGNFFTIHDLLRLKHGSVLRLTMLKTHYRQPIDWTEKEVLRSEDELRDWSKIIEDSAANVILDHDKPVSVDQGVIDALSDDLNTPAVISRLYEIARDAKTNREAARLLFVTGSWLGLRDLGKPGFFTRALASYTLPLDRLEVYHLAMMYRNLSANSQLQTSQDFLDELNRQNLTFFIDEHGTVDGQFVSGEKPEFITKVENLISARREAREAKNWAESDRIRAELADLKIVVKDNKDGTTTWEVAR
jgi:cysteinyl-tRNA synthetase